ncbi:MAG: DUF2891 domain-containing protein [Acidobacteria bacterium]|nr:DUF2891 domain-containing protein [Acidobacteriota bacterium]
MAGALLVLGIPAMMHAQEVPAQTRQDDLKLSQEQASRFVRLALHCIGREYPNKPEHVLNDASDVRGPKSLHPAFYGCYDWHSSVHGHWMLVRLLRLFPKLAEGKEIREALNRNLSRQNIQIELKYLQQANRQAFERTYGWAWLLKLAEELYRWDNSDARNWYRNLRPLADALALRYREFLPKQAYPIRTGVHPNTAFGLAFAYDYARAVLDRALEQVVRERATAYFATDIDYPAAWEPGGEDFFSPALVEADLMRRVMDPEPFRTWFQHFLPALGMGRHQSLLVPVRVTDRSDPKLVHLDGLNLSRAWCMFGIAAVLREDDPARKILLSAGRRHAEAGLAFVASGEYAGEHWLASFAVLMLTVEGSGH